MSTNAITLNGELINIDGRGNRVAFLCFGPENVIILAGMNKVVTNIEKYGNTSAASIPIALAESVEHGKVKLGSTALLCGFGAGMTWGGAIVRLREGIC